MPFFAVKSDKDSQEGLSSRFASTQSSNLLPRHFFPLSLSEYGDADETRKNNLLAVLVAVFVLVLSVTSFELWQYTPSIAAENGLLEVVQNVFLFTAFVTALLRYQLIRSSKSLDTYVFLGIALLPMMFFLRELDIDKLGSSPLWPVVEKVLRTLAAISVLGFVISVLRNSGHLLRNFSTLLAAPAVILVIIAGSLYVFSWPFDKKIIFAIDMALSQLIEELIESTAALLFALAAFSYGVKQSEPPR